MPLHPQARRLLDMIAVGAGGDWSVASRRAGLTGLCRIAGGRPDTSVIVEERIVAGATGPLPARLYAPARRDDPGPPPCGEGRVGEADRGGGQAGGTADASSGPPPTPGPSPQGGGERVGGSHETLAPGLVFFHGGGFVAGSLDDHDTLCRALAALAGCRILSVGYRLAPEHPFPAAIEDGLAAARAVAADPGAFGIDGARLAIGGNSAGGGIAARVCQELAAEGLQPFAVQFLLCPVLDAEGVEPSWSEFAEGHLLDVATFRADAAASGVGALSPDDPRASPGRAPIPAGLPPDIIHTAECDIVRDGGTAYAERLRRAGIPVRATCHPGTLHDFAMLTGLVPSARPALERIAADLAQSLSGPSPC